MDDWKEKLHARFPKPNEEHQADTAQQEARTARWLTETVKPAFQALKVELENEGRSVILQVGKLTASLDVVGPSGTYEFGYFIQMSLAPGQVMLPARSYWFERRGMQFDEPPLQSAKRPDAGSESTGDEIIQDFLQYYQPKP